MPVIDQTVIDQGLDSAERRTARELGSIGQGVDKEVRERLIRVLGAWPRPLSRRFLWDFSEQVGIADISRRHFQHSAPSEEDIRNHLDNSEKFMNSWTHP
jgi:hypothetical protein